MLKFYTKRYKGGGAEHWHYAPFQALAERLPANANLLYPGSDVDITPSLCFADVTYVDMAKGVVKFFSKFDKEVLPWVKEKKTYEREPKVTFLNKNARTVKGEYDAMLSLSALDMSRMCGACLKKGGLALLSDAHADARLAFTEPEVWELLAYWDGEVFQEDTDICFMTKPKKGKSKKGEAKRSKPTLELERMTREQAEESFEIGVLSKRSFVVDFEPMLYLFKRKV